VSLWSRKAYADDMKIDTLLDSYKETNVGLKIIKFVVGTKGSSTAEFSYCGYEIKLLLDLYITHLLNPFQLSSNFRKFYDREFIKLVYYSKVILIMNYDLFCDAFKFCIYAAHS